MSKSTENEEIDCGSIRIYPETDDKTLCVSLHGLISKEDYDKCFFKPLEAFVKKGIKFGLLIHYAEDYKGWTPGAADSSFRSIIDHGKDARKMAYVNPPESKIFQVKMAKPLLGGEVRYFDNDELAEALKWIKS
jgi:hypothetical protein